MVSSCVGHENKASIGIDKGLKLSCRRDDFVIPTTGEFFIDAGRVYVFRISVQSNPSRDAIAAENTYMKARSY